MSINRKVVKDAACALRFDPRSPEGVNLLRELLHKPDTAMFPTAIHSQGWDYIFSRRMQTFVFQAVLTVAVDKQGHNRSSNGGIFCSLCQRGAQDVVDDLLKFGDKPFFQPATAIWDPRSHST